MESRTNSISVTLDGDASTKTVLVKQGDSGTRFLQFTFTNTLTSTAVITLEEDTEVKVRFKLADGTSYEVEAEKNSSRTRATAQIPTEVMLNVGRVLVDALLYQDDELISTSTFGLRVIESAIGISGGQVIIGGKFYNVSAMTRQQFNATTPAENTVYMIDDSPQEDGSVLTIYLGSYKVATIGTGDDGTSSIFTYRDIAMFHQRQASLTSEIVTDNDVQTFTLELQRLVAARGDMTRIQYLKFYDDYTEDEESPIKSTAEVYADDIIRFKIGANTEVEITEEGVFFNGQKLGGGSRNIGQSVGLLSGISNSVIGQAEEVEE